MEQNATYYCACVSSAARVLFGSCALAVSYAAFSERTLMKCELAFTTQRLVLLQRVTATCNTTINIERMSACKRKKSSVERPTWSGERGAARVEQPTWSSPRGAAYVERNVTYTDACVRQRSASDIRCASSVRRLRLCPLYALHGLLEGEYSVDVITWLQITR